MNNKEALGQLVVGVFVILPLLGALIGLIILINAYRSK
jgi:hypothetical protein